MPGGFGSAFGSGFAGGTQAAADPYTVRMLIREALEELGVLDPVDPLDDEDAETGLRLVRRMAGAFEADRLLLYTEQFVPFVLTANQGSNTIGAGGSFDTTATLGPATARPLGMNPGLVTPVGDVIDYPLTPYASREAYYAEPYKTLTELWPRRFLYEPAWPLGLLTWWPVPTTAATVKLPLPLPLTAPDTIGFDTQLSFPPGYYEAWVLNLAKRACRPFRRKVDPDLRADAALALGVVRRLNDEGPPPARLDPALSDGRRWDIYTNRYR